LPDLVDALIESGKFNTFLEAARICGLVQTFGRSQGITVFAPTDEAFAKIPKNRLLLLLSDVDRLKSLFNLHLVDGSFLSSDLAKADYLQSVSGEELKIDSSFWQLMKRLKVNDAIIVKPDIVADNGVCHGINRVLVPSVVVEGALIS
jgi:uncharacterized surface protein with fasciclin (FAS1) repeats